MKNVCVFASGSGSDFQSIIDLSLIHIYAKFIAYGLNSGEQYLKSLGFKSVTVMKNGKFVEQSI